jgi:steroid 5-alpha reductase family enzyme
VAVGLVAVPCVMYATPVDLTGARPAEHDSLQRRPGYIEYQRTTSVLIPRRPRR